jgi:hypothetical protein
VSRCANHHFTRLNSADGEGWKVSSPLPKPIFLKYIVQKFQLKQYLSISFLGVSVVLCSFLQVAINPMTSFLHLQNAPYHALNNLQILYMLSIIFPLKYFATCHDKVFLNSTAPHTELTKLRDANATNTYNNNNNNN